MSEIVIAGSTGVIGRRAAREALAAGHGVTGVTRSARPRDARQPWAYAAPGMLLLDWVKLAADRALPRQRDERG